jgi:O-antigen ligase
LTASTATGRRSDIVGLVLVGLLAAWIIVTGMAAGSDPLPMLGVLFVAVLAYLGGRAIASAEAGAAVVGVAVVVVGLFMLPAALDHHIRATPFGYANADAALLAQGTAALVVVALSSRTPAVRGWAWAGAVSTAVVAVGLESIAGGALAAMVLVIGVVATRLRPGSAAAVGVAAVAVVVVVTVVLAVESAPETRAQSIAEQALSERRTALWQDALDLVVREPVLGVGPGNFSVLSPTAVFDPDTSETHSLYLQQAAETGLPGVVLVLGLLIWAYVGMARSGRGPPLAVVGVAGLTAFAIHAAVDYVAHFPVVVATAAYLVGLLSHPDPVRSAAAGPGRPRA